MSPRTKNYLYNAQSDDGLFIFQDEMKIGKLKGFPYFTTTQIPNTLGSGSDSEVYLVDFSETMILESRRLEFFVALNGLYVDEFGAKQSAFQNDAVLVRGIAAKDFQMKHDEAVVMITGVRWAAS